MKISFEIIRLKILIIFRRGNLFVSRRKKDLKQFDFTIISNNCWGGMIYESYGLPKQSPTVGMFFLPEDYIKFVSDLKGFINGKLDFITPNESKWKDSKFMKNSKKFGTYPIGRLSNGKEEIELFFLHYKNNEEAKIKWERRCKRINYEKMLIKFNDQNGCTEENINAFLKLPYRNKIFFTSRKWSSEKEYIEQLKQGYVFIKSIIYKDYIRASYEPFGKSRYLNVTKLLNSL